MTRVFVSVTFVDNGKRIRPLSVGMVSDDLRLFYRVVKDDTAVFEAMGSDWARHHVLPYLPVEWDGRAWQWDHGHADWRLTLPRGEVAADVAAFLGAPGPAVFGWDIPHQYVALSQLAGPYPSLLYQMTDMEQDWMRAGFPDLPKQERGRHHALWDALYLQQIAPHLEPSKRVIAT